jgi:uncharacterized BrkB/YihY/UPF0761 family membrane protein
MSLYARVAILAAAILILFGTVSAVLLHLLPGPHKETDYLVIGAVSTLVSLLALFLVLITGFMRLPNVFFKKRKSQSRP